MASVEINLNSAGIKALLKSGGVQADVMRRATNVARAAGAGFEARATPRANRARAEAVTATFEAMVRHSKRGALIQAISAARG